MTLSFYQIYFVNGLTSNLAAIARPRTVVEVARPNGLGTSKSLPTVPLPGNLALLRIEGVAARRAERSERENVPECAAERVRSVSNQAFRSAWRPVRGSTLGEPKCSPPWHRKHAPSSRQAEKRDLTPFLLRLDLLRVGAPGKLLLSGEIEEVLPLEDPVAHGRTRPVDSEGRFNLDAFAIEEREDAQVGIILKGGRVSIVVLG